MDLFYTFDGKEEILEDYFMIKRSRRRQFKKLAQFFTGSVKTIVLINQPTSDKKVRDFFTK